jgi:hypothetical protein
MSADAHVAADFYGTAQGAVTARLCASGWR